MSNFVETRQPCDICGSSDARAYNADGSSYCFSGNCPTPYQPSPLKVIADKPKQFSSYSKTIKDHIGLFSTREFSPIPERSITVSTAKKYNALVDGDTVIFGYAGEDGVTAAKVRKKDKQFLTEGDWSQAGLYGQSLFSAGSAKAVTLVEGEYDALAAYQMQGSQYPVVSIKNGAGSALKDCKANFKWLDSFETIVICFDMDEPGQKAAKEVAELFAGKSKIMKMSHKDASDCLKANETKEFMKAWWAAEEFVPDSIIPSSQLHDEVMKPLQMPFCSYPWDGLNLMLYGIRSAEIITVMGGSGVGKSTFVKEILREIHQYTDFPIGVLSLEESSGVSAMKMMSLASSKQFHLPTVKQMKAILKDPTRVIEKPYLEDCTEEERLESKEKAFKEILGSDRFMFLSHEGNITMDSVLGQMRYLAKAKDCKVILLDHISILVGLVVTGKGNEREAIDNVMHRLRTLVEETGITLVNISHLTKPSDGVGHEEGRRVQAREARGSGAIVQLSDIGIALEANRQSDDAQVRNTTIVRVLKNRFSGETGQACELTYDLETGRLTEAKQEAL
jgi:twinkle protein